MTHHHSLLRTLIVVSLWMCATAVHAQQPMLTEPLPTFDPYATPQAPMITGPALPTIDPSAMVILPTGTPARCVLFGEFLYLRASDAAMTNYALPVDPSATDVPMGPVAFVEQSWEPGFRAGFEWIWNDYSRWVATYTSLDLKASSMVSEPGALSSLVLHPSTDSSLLLYDAARAAGDVKMRLADIDYRRVFVEEWYRWDFFVGARYAKLNQRFAAEFTDPTPPSDNTENVGVKVNFDGGGIRFGTRGDWRSSQHGFFIYAQATTSFVAGRFSSNYLQAQTNAAGTTVAIANTSLRDDRIINLTDAELGLGWHSASQRCWFSAGYLFNTWSDVVNSSGFIRSVQTNSFSPIRERMTFDGLVARVELRF